MFVKKVLSQRSVAIVGLAKNAGKTECLNYILRKAKEKRSHTLALTSIGIDGESVDQVCRTPKPEIEVFKNTYFVTSEKHFREKRIVAEVMNVSTQQTSLGRLITARAKSDGKVLLSGPADTGTLKDVIREMRELNVKTTLVDGALSRLSFSSPAVTDAMVLATGAAVSGNIPQLVRKTKYVHDLIKLRKVHKSTADKLLKLESGIWAIDAEGKVHDLDIPSALMLDQRKEELFKYGSTIYVAGAVSDKMLTFLRQQKQIGSTRLIMRDFTRMFATPENFYAFTKKGGRVEVLQKSKLIAVCVNPQSPDGFCLDSDKLIEAMKQGLGIKAVYDVKRME